MESGGLLRARLPASRGFTGRCLNNVRAALLSVIFPAGCRICEQLLTEATRIPICNDCLDSFRPITDAVCDKCGRPAAGADTSDAEAFVCPTCVNDEWGGYAFERVRSWAVYEGALVRAILLLKFENIDPLGKLFAGWLAQVAVDGGPAFEADVVVPVPLHRPARARTWLQPSGANRQTAGQTAGVAVQICFTHENPAAPQQAFAKLRRALGIGPWRFCHTSGQPS
jgi:predicted amidophosphoribosyltransferase